MYSFNASGLAGLAQIAKYAVVGLLLASPPAAVRAADGVEGSAEAAAGYIIVLKGGPMSSLRAAGSSAAAMSRSRSATSDAADILRGQQDRVLSRIAASPASAARPGSSSSRSTGSPRDIHRYSLAANALYVSELSDSELADLRAMPDVETVYEDFLVHATLSRSVPAMGVDGAGGFAAWDQTGPLGRSLKGDGIRIGILDTGIDYRHFDLGGCIGKGCKVEGGYDFINRDRDPLDDQGHGTHVASIAAGNGIVRGVAPNATLHAIKVLGKSGSGPSSAIMKGLEYALDPNGDCCDVTTGQCSFVPACMDDHLDVVNLSLGVVGGTTDDELASFVDNVVEAGVVVVAAAGNDGPKERTIGTPGSSLRAITVGNLNSYTGEMSSTSSIGPVTNNDETEEHTKPDVIAPGTAICAARFDGDWKMPGQPCIGDSYMATSGTSMAAPHVAGAAALALQLNPQWLPEDVKGFFMETAIDSGFDVNVQGKGLVNLEALAATAQPGPIVARINSPERSTGEIDLTGTVIVNQPAVWVLTIAAPGQAPQRLSEGQLDSGATLSALFEGLDLRDLTPDVPMKIALEVTTATDSARDSITLWSDHLDFSRVEYRFPDLTFIGELGMNNIDGYVVQAKVSGSLWENALTVIESDGPPAVDDLTGQHLIGSWNPGDVRGYYDFRVLVYRNGEGAVDSVDSLEGIYIEPDLQDGWPSSVPGSILSQIRVHDLDGDGDNEVIVPYVVGEAKAEIAVFDHRGTMLQGWPQDGGSLWKPDHAMLIYDSDGDGVVEIITPGHYKPVNAWNIDGTLARAPFSEGVLGREQALVLKGWVRTDLDGDGRFEVIADYVREISIYNDDGTLRQTVQVTEDSGLVKNIMTQPAVGDLDGDGLKEIVVTDGLSRLYVLSQTSGEYTSQRVYTPEGIDRARYYRTMPVLGDIDGDGIKEIIVSTNEGMRPLYADGTPVPGDWPKKRGGPVTTPILADLNGDLIPEIIAPPVKNLIYSNQELPFWAFHADGSVVDGWPARINDYVNIIGSPNFMTQPTAGDIDNDGEQEIVFAPTPSAQMLIFEADGTRTSGRPLPLEPRTVTPGASGSGLLVDLDNDGDIEFLAGTQSGQVIVWDLNGAANAAIDWPMHGGSADMSGDFKGGLSFTPSPPDEPASPDTPTDPETPANVDPEQCPNSVFDNGKMYDADNSYVDNQCALAGQLCGSVFFYGIDRYSSAQCTDGRWAADDAGAPPQTPLTPDAPAPESAALDHCPNSIFGNGMMYDAKSSYRTNHCLTPGARCSGVYLYAEARFGDVECANGAWSSEIQ